LTLIKDQERSYSIQQTAASRHILIIIFFSISPDLEPLRDANIPLNRSSEYNVGRLIIEPYDVERKQAAVNINLQGRMIFQTGNGTSLHHGWLNQYAQFLMLQSDK
jgi:hypothetical protein